MNEFVSPSPHMDEARDVLAISARGVWPWLVFGLVLAAAVLYFVGSFQGSELLHDLLHDGRHLLGIPCH